MRHNIKKVLEWFRNYKRNIIVLSIFVIIVLVTIIIASVIPSIGSTFLILSLFALIMVTCLMASTVIFKSFFSIGGGLTLMIYIADTYCKLPSLQHTADGSLKTLFGFGLIYIFWLFFNNLYKELFGDNNEKVKGSFEKIGDKHDGKKPIIITIPYAVFIGIFIYQLYQVMLPIIHSLCIY